MQGWWHPHRPHKRYPQPPDTQPCMQPCTHAAMDARTRPTQTCTYAAMHTRTHAAMHARTRPRQSCTQCSSLHCDPAACTKPSRRLAHSCPPTAVAAALNQCGHSTRRGQSQKQAQKPIQHQAAAVSAGTTGAGSWGPDTGEQQTDRLRGAV